MTRNNLGRKGFISSFHFFAHPMPHSIPEESGTQWETGGGTRAEAVKACCLLACSLWLLPTYFITSSRTTSPSMPITPTQLARPCCINHSRKCSTDLPTGQPNRNTFSVEVTSCQMILACIKLTKN